MHSKIVLVGPGASGKDFLRKKFQTRGFKFGVSCTTRPIREEEEEGVDYYYLSDQEFKDQIESGKMLEYQEFNNWYYGISKDEFEACDVLILNAEAVEKLPEEYRNRCFVIYTDIDHDIRLERLRSRKDFDNPERRIMEDEKQFRNFSDYDCRITNEDF